MHVLQHLESSKLRPNTACERLCPISGDKVVEVKVAGRFGEQVFAIDHWQSGRHSGGCQFSDGMDHGIIVWLEKERDRES